MKGIMTSVSVSRETVKKMKNAIPVASASVERILTPIMRGNRV